MSEYIGGPLDVLSKLFLMAFKCKNENQVKFLIEEWNKEIDYLNKYVLEVKNHG